jgi:hypothetical protein
MAALSWRWSDFVVRPIKGAMIGSGFLLGCEGQARLPGRIMPPGMTSNRLRPRWISTYALRQVSSAFERTFTRSPLDQWVSIVFSLTRYVSHGGAPVD